MKAQFLQRIASKSLALFLGLFLVACKQRNESQLLTTPENNGAGKLQAWLKTYVPLKPDDVQKVDNCTYLAAIEGFNQHEAKFPADYPLGGYVEASDDGQTFFVDVHDLRSSETYVVTNGDVTSCRIKRVGKFELKQEFGFCTGRQDTDAGNCKDWLQVQRKTDRFLGGFCAPVVSGATCASGFVGRVYLSVGEPGGVLTPFPGSVP